MAVNQLGFGAQVDSWVLATRQRTEAVFRESTQRVVSIAQSRVPVDTGFLRASVRASLSSMPPINPGATNPAKAPTTASGEYVLTIAQAQLGDIIYVGYTAAYAGHVEYGTSRMAPRAFVGGAAAQWPAIVNTVVQELKARVRA